MPGFYLLYIISIIFCISVLGTSCLLLSLSSVVVSERERFLEYRIFRYVFGISHNYYSPGLTPSIIL